MLTHWILLATLTAAARPQTERFSVMTYNVLYDSTLDDRSLALIERESPDVVCLEELTPKFAKAFEKRLGKKYPHRAFAPKKGTWGVGIASRHPIANHRVFPQEPHRIPAIDGEVKLPGGSLRVACVHWMPPMAKHRKSDGLAETARKNEQLRLDQSRSLLARYERSATPVVIAGDLNETSSGAGFRAILEAGYEWACKAPDRACGATWPGDTSVFPAVVEIDHIFGKGVRFRSARRLVGGGSDHHAVMAVADWTRGTEKRGTPAPD